MQHTESTSRTSLDEIAIKHGTDKSSLGHNYCVLYEKHLPPKINKMLEIGVWKGQGIRTFKEWYGDSGEFYALDRFIKGHGLVTISQLQAEGIHSLEGDHDDTGWLRTINHVFDVIIDDGSHHWVSQINTFRIMFVNNLAPGGVFVIEDVFDDDYWGQGIIKSPNGNLKGLLNKFKTEGNIAGQLVTPEESNIICPLIDEINIYKEIVFIKKK